MNSNATHNADAAQTHLGVAALLAMTTALGPLAIDTYLPAFPAIADSLGVTIQRVSLSIPVYIFVLALGQLIGGPLSDRFGRRVIMLSGLAIFGLGSLLISLSHSLEALLVLRAVQAFGGGWASVCVPALVRDRLAGYEAARFFSLIGLIVIAAPAIAPSLGSLILYNFSWNGIFLFLALYAMVAIPLVKRVIFPGELGKRMRTQPLTIWQRYRAVFATRPALRYMALQAMAFGIMLLFITHAAFIYQVYFGQTPAMFALLFGANIAALVVVNLVNRHLLRRVSPQKLLRWGLTLQSVGITLLVLVALFSPRLGLFVPAMMITVGAMGAIAPNNQACFMEFFAESGGTASALLGAIQYSVAGLIGAASTLLPDSLVAVVLAQAICSLLCLILVWVGAATRMLNRAEPSTARQ